MKFEGNYNFYIDGKSVSIDDVRKLVTTEMTASVQGLDVFYHSPKKIKKATGLSLDNLKYFMINQDSTEKDLTDVIHLITAENKEDLSQRFAEIKLKNSAQKKSKTEEILEEVNRYQEQNGGKIEGVEFPFDAVLTPTKNNCIIVEEKDIFSFLGYAENTLKEREQKLIDDWNKACDIKSPVYETIVSPFNKKVLDLNDVEDKKYFDTINNTLGVKETEGKLDYSEINFKLLDLMAKRFMENKNKYPKGNTLKVIDKDEILWAAFRHLRKMIQPVPNDPETYEDHLAATATNLSIILDQLDLEVKK